MSLQRGFRTIDECSDGESDDQLARNATSRRGLGQRLLGRSRDRIADRDRWGCVRVARSHNMKSSIARLTPEEYAERHDGPSIGSLCHGPKKWSGQW